MNEEYSRAATWEDVVRVVSLLDKYGARYVLVGGYALAAHGLLRMTEDIDIAVESSPENAKKWMLALSELPDGVTREMLHEEDPFEGDYEHAIRINDEFSVDIMPSVCGIPFSEIEKEATMVDIAGARIPVLTLKGLLMTKQGLREKDKMDAAILKRAIERLEENNDAYEP